MASTSDRLQAAAAVAAIGISAFAYQQSRDGLRLAESNEERLNRQDTQQFANKVYMGEPSPAEYGQHPLPPGATIWRVVINASGLQVEDVWVSDGDRRSVRIQGLQRCSMYALPADFDAKHLYFTDPYGQWHRPWGGQLETLEGEEVLPLPDPDTDISPWWGPVQDCAG